MEEVQKLYNSLLEDGDLFVFVGGMKGEWEKDKKKFSAYYQEQMDFLNDCDVEMDEDPYS